MNQVQIGLSKIEAQLAGKKVPYLGALFWYTVGAVEVPSKDLIQLYKELKIPKTYLPKPIRKIDVFKTVCKEQESIIRLQNIKEVFLVRPVRNARLFIREERDLNNRRLSYQELGRWTYENGEIKAESFISSNHFGNATQRVLSRFQKMVDHYDSKDLRMTLRRMLYSLPTIQLRPSGGVYFVPKAYIELINKFAQLFEIIRDKYSISVWGLELYTVPVVDTDRQRKTIAYKYEQEAVETIEALHKSMTENLNTPISQAAWNKYNEEINRLKKLGKEYEKLLQVKMVKTALRISTLSDILGKLSENLKGG